MFTDLTFKITDQGVRALQQHSLLRQYTAAPLHKKNLTDTYFDTPDEYLRRHGMYLYVRQSGKKWVQILKVNDHHQWESSVTGSLPDLTKFLDLLGKKHRYHKLLQYLNVSNFLSPVFSANIKHTTWTLHFPQCNEIECTLNQGTLILENKKIPFREIEFALKTGNPTCLFDFLIALQQDIRIKITSLNTAERAYAMRSPRPYTTVGALPLKLRKSMTVEQAFQEISENCLAQIHLNEAGVAFQYEQESLHQMRIGLRRLRCACGLFKDVLQLPDELRQEIDWLSKRLGNTRDWDVLSNSTLPLIIQALQNSPQLDVLYRAVQEKANEQHKTASTAINSARYTRFILGMNSWLYGRNWRDINSQNKQRRLQTGIMNFTQTLLEHGNQRLHKHGRKFNKMDVIERHRVRISVKKMRYSIDFFQSLSPPKKMQTYLNALLKLQNELGRLNDITVADRLLKKLQVKQSNLNVSAGLAREYIASIINHDNQKISTLWKQFSVMK